MSGRNDDQRERHANEGALYRNHVTVPGDSNAEGASIMGLGKNRPTRALLGVLVEIWLPTCASALGMSLRM